MVERLVHSEVNKQRIAAVENCFGISGEKLAMPGRVLVGEGILTKMCRKKAKPRQFFLFNDILVYGNILIKNKKYSRQHIIGLEEVRLEDIPDDDVMKNGWYIKTPTKSFAVYAATATEKAEWMEHILKCVNELLKRTGKQPINEHAAVWVPDSEARQCMHCRKTQFSLLNRRHHCRSCGDVICGNCSKNKFLIPSQSSKPVRVCDSCYDKLSKGRTGLNTYPDANATNGTISEESKVTHPKELEAAMETPPRRASHTESSDSEDDKDEYKDTEDIQCDGIIMEKPTFYSTSFNIEDEVPSNAKESKEAELE